MTEKVCARFKSRIYYLVKSVLETMLETYLSVDANNVPGIGKIRYKVTKITRDGPKVTSSNWKAYKI